jgi:hypothetical protein
MSVVVVGHTGPAVAVNKKTSSTVAEAAPRRKVTAGDRPFLELAMTKQIDQRRGMEGKRGMCYYLQLASTLLCTFLLEMRSPMEFWQA